MATHSGFLRLALLGAFCVAAAPVLAETPVATADFKCAEGKSIVATFYADKVDLKLSDDRDLALPQVISGSGARYANADESVVFWNKGNTAFVTEGEDQTSTYSDCVAPN